MGSWEPPSFQAAQAFDVSDASSEWASTSELKAPLGCMGFHSVICWSLGGCCHLIFVLFYALISLVFTLSVTLSCFSYLVVWFGFGVYVYLYEVLVWFTDKGLEDIHSTC